jgi:Mg-chelatase subunit ChlD
VPSIGFERPLVLGLILPVLALTLYAARLGRRRLPLGPVVLRSVIASSLVFALAGLRLNLPVDRLAVAFLVDRSDSIGAENRAAQEAFIRQAVARLRPEDEWAVIAFGAEPLVDRSLAPGSQLAGIASVPDGSRTDIEAAIRLAMGLLPPDRARRLVLLTDGNENQGEAARQADLLAAAGVELWAVTLSGRAGPEVRAERLVAPGRVREGQVVELRGTVWANQPADATVRLLADGTPVAEQAVRLQAGFNNFAFQVGQLPPGFHNLALQVTNAPDTYPQNNESLAVVQVLGQTRTLLVGAGADRAPVAAALRAAGMPVTEVEPENLPGSLDALRDYDVVVLANVPADVLGEKLKVLATLIRELGRGLVVIGGERSYALGVYHRTPLADLLPVDLEPKSYRETPSVAFVAVIDKSGSMGNCHGTSGACGSPPITGPPPNIPKVELAKEATFQALQRLGPRDEVGVLVFDSVARWVARPQANADLQRIFSLLASVRAEGGTNIYAGLAEAVEALKKSQAAVKHIVLMTDGWSRTGDFGALIQEMKAHGITLSTIGVGGGSADLLQTLAKDGGGRYYAVADAREVPQILLKETEEVQRTIIVEETFRPAPADPSPILQGLRALPPLHGYLGTSPKTGAQVILRSPKDDPILAAWQTGLGRVVAWTSDAKGRWARDWVNWAGFATFWRQVVDWAGAAPTGEGLRATIRTEGANGVLTVDLERSTLPEGHALNARVVAPDGTVRTVRLDQTGPGEFEGVFPAGQPGTYYAAVTEQAGEQTVRGDRTALAVAYSAEYRDPAGNPGLLSALVRATGGRLNPEPADVFQTAFRPVRQSTPLYPWLLLLAVLLWPLDIAARRLGLGPAAVIAGATSAVRQRLAARRAVEMPAMLGRLRARKTVASSRLGQVGMPPRPDAGAVESSGGDLSRLREAKLRARRETGRAD